jgi:pimeloyl-ACP methyl ester carboxylesterase
MASPPRLTSIARCSPSWRSAGSKASLDIQGLGFSDRPEHFDYTWTGLSGWLERALDAAGVGAFHLVVHDVGGPIGFDLIRRIPHRISSLTVLNTFAEVSKFR